MSITALPLVFAENIFMGDTVVDVLAGISIDDAPAEPSFLNH